MIEQRKRILDLYKEGKRQEAEPLARALLAEKPDDAETLSLLAAMLVDRQAFPEAESALRRALEIASHSPIPWTNLGRFLQQHGRWAEADEHFTKARAAFPRNPVFHLTHGQILQRSQRFGRAEDAFTAAVQLQPDNAHAHVLLGMVILRRGRAEEAVATFKRAIELNPKMAAAYGNLGNAEQKLGHDAEAEAAYEQASLLDPKDALSYVSFGLAKLRRGAAREAAQIFDMALAKHGPERRAAAWFPYARAQEIGEMPGGFRAGLARLITRRTLTPPEGFASLETMNAKLAEALTSDPTLTWEPSGKATRKGGQTGLLLDAPREPWLSFERALRKEIDAYFDTIKREKNHPFLSQVPRTYHLDLWGTVLQEGGYQHSHIHIGGWMSGVYYVSLPPVMDNSDETKEGWIEFGHPPPEFKAEFEPKTVAYRPKAGDALFFPSYFFHRTLPFTDKTPRISLAFDVKPTSWR